MHLSHDLKLLDDGLNTVEYKVLKNEKTPLCTRILVKLPKPDEIIKKDLYNSDSGKMLIFIDLVINLLNILYIIRGNYSIQKL